ncbi:MAG: formyltransferase family protein [Candidatus Omnitrophica bacterium]|nr:formyltransferase family protein [Candidatus Omnitrophota bacterium]
MKLAILTSDSLDARIVLQELIAADRDIAVILYEKKKRSFKSRVKLLLLFLSGKIEYLTFKSMERAHGKKIIVKATANINAQENVELLAQLKPELTIIVGTRKIDKKVYDIAKFGAINLHTGILPFYRGADSEYWALANNEIDKIGVTIHFVNDTLDAGDMIIRARQQVHPNDTYKMLRLRNLFLGARKINEAIDMICSHAVLPVAQRESVSATYKSICARAAFLKKREIKPKAVIKEFGLNGFRVRERVAQKASLVKGAAKIIPCELQDVFCLRVDADAYHDNFCDYLDVFKKYRECVTIFFCAAQFLKSKHAILGCRDGGLDIQSHGFYHHVYNDFASNMHNIGSAKDFFLELGINTTGFVAPMGKYHPSLMEALEKQGYRYSSDFSFDYLGYPYYPALEKRFYRILQIPVFPVCPELFFFKGIAFEAILDYYKHAMLEMKRCNIPVIVYTHTSPFSQNPALLRKVLDFAFCEMKLKPMTMTQIYQAWRNSQKDFNDGALTRIFPDMPDASFFGKEVPVSFARKVKDALKEFIDYETETPFKELQSTGLKRTMKTFARQLRGVTR